MNPCFKKHLNKLIVFGLYLSLLGCSPFEKPLRVGAAPWPNFEFTFLAGKLGFLNKKDYSLLELTSSTGVIQAFQRGRLDLAFLSLDEVLTLVDQGIDLKIISVIDNSVGGDAILARPTIKSLSALKWHNIGYENKAPGALLLSEVFSLTELNNQTVQLFEVKQNEAKDAYLKGALDALVVREPVKQQLLALGAKELINSKQLNLQNTHLIVARGDTYLTKQDEIVKFLTQYYRAHEFYEQHTGEALAIMSVRLQIYPSLLRKAFLNTKFIMPKEALLRLSGSPSNIELQAKELSKLMNTQHMLGQTQTDISSLISTQSLERAIYE